jgi:hypothetical protein
LHRLIVEDRLEGRAAVFAPPDAATRRADEDLDLAVGSRFAAMAEMRPLIAAEPMLRAPRPEIVPEL